MYTCYIIDDETHAIDTLSGYIDRVPGLQLLGTHTNPLQALNEINSLLPDIVFADIDMPQLSGLDLADLIKDKTNIIFTTAFASYAVEAFDKQVADFLLKPISFQRFLKAVKQAEKNLQPPVTEKKDDGYFFINPGIKGKMVRLNYDDIIYVEGLKNYIMVYTAEEKHITYLTMTEIEEVLLPVGFIRIHKSFIVNFDKIKKTDTHYVILENKTQLPLGSSYKRTFMDYVTSKSIITKRK